MPRKPPKSRPVNLTLLQARAAWHALAIRLGSGLLEGDELFKGEREALVLVQRKLHATIEILRAQEVSDAA
jgi:hypothetical protein